MMDWKDQTLKTEQIYQNVMELLVQEEIEKQLKCYPQLSATSFNSVEIEAYALNRLPTLYASSEKGRDLQKKVGRQRYQKEISMAVRRALATVEQNPHRESRALVSISDLEKKCQESQKALQKLQLLLIRTQLIDNSSPELTWDNLVTVVTFALNKLYFQGHQQNLNLQIHSQKIKDELNIGWDSSFIL